MVAFRLDTFGGMVPAVFDELLPASAASLSQNTWLYEGTLRGLPDTKPLRELISSTASIAYRLPKSYDRSTYLFSSVWLEFPHPDTDVVRAPVFGDVHDRYYWASPLKAPEYNTRQRIEAGLLPWRLGINPPLDAPKLEVTGGSIRVGDARVATTTSGVFATDFAKDKTVDGIVLKENDRILIKDQDSSPYENGLFIVGTGAPTRAEDMDVSTEFVNRYVKILEGASNRGTVWKVANSAAPIVGTDPITFEETTELPLEVTRSYVYTWVTEYGEESAPSRPVVMTGIQNGSWNLSDLQVPEILDQGLFDGPLPPNRFIVSTRIYRTITSTQGVATFFLVDEIPCTQTTFDDDISDNDVSQNNILETFSWTPPPDDLKGLTVMWNGMVAGFRENELWVCEPYRPHAWPAAHVLTFEFPIIGLGVANQTLVACTSGNPVTVNGASPNNLSYAKIARFEPCTSRGSILSSPNGVVFVSPNGLILCGQGGAINLTKDLVTRDKWREHAGEALLKAAWFGEAYYAFGGVTPEVFEATPAWVCDPSNDTDLPSPPNPPRMSEPWISHLDFAGALKGVLIDALNPRVAFNLLTSDKPVLSVQNDPWSGEVFIVRDGFVNWLDITDFNQPYQPGLWRSKTITTLDKRNIGAMRLHFEASPGLPELGPRNVDPVQTLGPNQWGICRLYADDKLVFTREIRESGELWKLPSGFLAEHWEYEIETRLKISSIQIASSAKELASL